MKFITYVYRMPTYIDYNDYDDYEDYDSQNLQKNDDLPLSNKNQIVIYLKCSCCIVSPVDNSTEIQTSYYCTECRSQQTVLATVRHLLR